MAPQHRQSGICISKEKNFNPSLSAEYVFILWGQITGGILDVKKPLIDVSTCLQDCSLLDGSPAPVTRPLGDSSYRAFPDPELLPHLCSPLSLLAGNSGTNALNGNMSSSLIHADGAVSCQDKKGSQQEVVFRMLCSNHAAGCVIGKRGSIVRALQNETGASISFAAPLTEAGERVVTISAWEVCQSVPVLFLILMPVE